MNLSTTVVLWLWTAGLALGSYEACRKDALQRLTSAPEQKAALKECLVQFPSAALYIDCKKQMLQRFGKDPKTARAKLDECKSLRQAASYDPAELVPYDKIANRHFFAGADLSFEVGVSTIPKINDFYCERLSDVLEGFADPSYLLFGNEPRAFTALGSVKLEARRKGTAAHSDIAKLGRIYWGAKPLLYFPSGACVFKGNLGKHFEDLQIYYLIDAKRHQIAPYFGIAFYKAESTASISEIATQLAAKMGSRIQTTTLRSGASFLAPFQPQSYDSEGDPTNVCLHPRSDAVVAMIRPQKKRRERASAVLVANLKSLCSFGDQLTQALTKKPGEAPTKKTKGQRP